MYFKSVVTKTTKNAMEQFKAEVQRVRESHSKRRKRCEFRGNFQYPALKGFGKVWKEREELLRENVNIIKLLDLLPSDVIESVLGSLTFPGLRHLRMHT